MGLSQRLYTKNPICIKVIFTKSSGSGLTTVGSLEWAQLSRDTAWGKSVIGVTYPYMSEQFGVFLVNEEDYQLSSGVSIGSAGAFLIHIDVSGSYSCREGDDHYRNGPMKPFFGKKHLRGLILAHNAHQYRFSLCVKSYQAHSPPRFHEPTRFQLQRRY